MTGVMELRGIPNAFFTSTLKASKARSSKAAS